MLMPVLNSGHYSSINTVIYASVNLPVKSSGQPFERTLFWAPWFIKGKPTVAESFLYRLADAWMAHMSVVTAAPVFQIEPPAEGIDGLRFA